MNQYLLPPKRLEQVASEEVIALFRERVHIRISDIIRLEAERNYTRIIMADGRPILTSRNLSFYEPLLPEEFVRVHKSHLINRCYILQNCQTYISMSDGVEVEVARRKRRVVKCEIN